MSSRKGLVLLLENTSSWYKGLCMLLMRRWAVAWRREQKNCKSGLPVDLKSYTHADEGKCHHDGKNLKLKSSRDAEEVIETLVEPGTTWLTAILRMSELVIRKTVLQSGGF